MHGGFPNASGYRLYARNTNLKEIFDKQLPYPLGDPDPSNGEFEQMLKGDITRKLYSFIFPVKLDNYDIIHFALSGGPGYGDPLERKLESVKKDLDDEIYTKDIVYNVYGVVANFDNNKKEWIIDKIATQKRREEIKKERREKSMTFEEFWEYERKKITENKLYESVASMYSESIELSKRWGKEFKEFWEFPDTFKIEVK